MKPTSGWMSRLGLFFIGVMALTLIEGCTTRDGSPKRAAEEAFPSKTAQPENKRAGVKTVFMSEAPLVGEHAKNRVYGEGEARRHLRPFIEFIRTHYGQEPTYWLRGEGKAQMHEINRGSERPEFVLLYSPMRSYCAEKVGYRSIHPSSNYYRSLMFARVSDGAPRSLKELATLANSRKIKVAYRPFSTSSMLAPLAALADMKIPRDRVELVKAKNKGDLLQRVASGAVDVAALQNTLYDRYEFDSSPIIAQVRPIWISQLLPSGAFMVDSALLKRETLPGESRPSGGDSPALVDARHSKLRMNFANLFGQSELQNALRDVNVFRPTQSLSFASVLGPLFDKARAWTSDDMDWCKSGPAITPKKAANQ